jgi:ariadne-1
METDENDSLDSGSYAGYESAASASAGAAAGRAASGSGGPPLEPIAEAEPAFGAARFVSMTAAQLRPRMARAVADVCEVTTLAPGDAALALHAFRWSAERLLDAWWADAEAFRARVGLRAGAPAPLPPAPARAFCAVELEDFAPEDMRALPCGHWFSARAWRAALDGALADPFAAQLVRCLAAPACNELVRAPLFEEALPPPALDRWRAWGVRRFARDSRAIVWCPGLDCAYAVVARESGRPSTEVACLAGHAFCFGCGGAPHRPATCADVAAWARRESVDGLNALFLAERTKPCPKCKW